MKLLKLKNRRTIFFPILFCVVLFLILFFRYKETGVYDYNGVEVKITMDRIRMKCFFCDPWNTNYGVTTSDQYYVVFLDRKEIFRFIGLKSSESCVSVLEECSYIESNSIILYYYGQGALLKIIIPLDGKKHLLKDLKITGYKHHGSLTCEELRNGYGKSIYATCTLQEIDVMLKWEVVDY